MTQTPDGLFEAGQSVIVAAGPEPAHHWYRTTVRRVDARMVWVDGALTDQEDQPPLEVQPGEDVTCHTWRHMDALYRVDARVAFARLAPAPLIGLMVRAVERIQQREFVRVPLSTEAWGLYLGSGARLETLATPSLATQSLRVAVSDLSASGLRGRSNHPLAPGDELEIDLPLPRIEQSERTFPPHARSRMVRLPNLSEPLSLRARVVRLIGNPATEDLACEIGVAFLDASRAAQERIIRFALDVQREQRRRGLL